MRLLSAFTPVLVKCLNAKHLKRWTLFSVNPTSVIKSKKAHREGENEDKG